MIGTQQERAREEDSGNSISAGGMQSEAQAGEGGGERERNKERERKIDEGGRERERGGAFWVECSQLLITSAG